MREGFHSKTWPPPPDPSGVPPVRRTHLAPTSPHLAPTSHPHRAPCTPAPAPKPQPAPEQVRSIYLVCHISHISPHLPISPPQVRSIYLVWNERLKLARLPLKYFANGHSFFVQVTPTLTPTLTPTRALSPTPTPYPHPNPHPNPSAPHPHPNAPAFLPGSACTPSRTRRPPSSCT